MCRLRCLDVAAKVGPSMRKLDPTIPANIAVADRWLALEQSNDNWRPQAVESEVAAVHGCHTDDMGNHWYLVSWVGNKTGWQWVKECDCSCDELTSAFFDMEHGAFLPLEWN